jgi:hypothetical protein
VQFSSAHVAENPKNLPAAQTLEIEVLPKLEIFSPNLFLCSTKSIVAHSFGLSKAASMEAVLAILAADNAANSITRLAYNRAVLALIRCM